MPATRGVWQSDMLDWLALYDGPESFSPVGASAPPPTVPADEAARVVAARDGVLLKSGMVLKADQFPGLQSPHLKGPRINGAPNFRALPARPGDDANVVGVAQPTIEGIRGVLDAVGAGPGPDAKTAVWTNLREEPVTYVNGKPLNLRRASDVFENLENPGASGRDVERSDDQLKSDVLREAAKNGGRLMVHDEGPDGRIVERWETVTPESVQTPREVYDMLRQEGYHVDYARIPVADEKRPEEKDFDALTERVKNAPPDAPLIFNCHAGRGRTTTGMVVAGLARRAMEGESDASITRSRPVHEDIREQGKYRRGEYKSILGMIGVLEQGPQSKDEADRAIDRYSALTNLRESIEPLKDRSDRGDARATARGKDYLDRYFYLIAYDAYAREQAPGGFEQPFSAWMKGHPELYRMRENLELAMNRAPGADDTAYA